MKKHAHKKRVAIDPEKLKLQLEALLFAAGKPLAYPKLFRLLNAKEVHIKKAIASLREEYKKGKRGIQILDRNNTVEMVTNAEYGNVVSGLLKFEKEEQLSSSVLETLTIVAYRGPITRADLETVRGVNSQYTLRNLVKRGLIIQKQDMEDSRQSIYEVSERFLKHMGITSVAELPEFGELSQKTSFEQYLEKKEKEQQEKVIAAVNR
jgi:segregation and condensation protein B